jgi:hypothetical protein
MTVVPLRVVDETPEEIREAITTLAAESARMPDHWVDRKAALHARIDDLLDRLQ